MEAAATPPPPPSDISTGRRPIEVGRVLSESFRLYRENVAPLLGVGAIIAVVSGVLVGIAQDDGSLILQFVANMIQLIATYLYTGFVVKLVQDVRDGRRDSSVGDLVSAAMPALVPLIIFAVLAGIAITIGLILLIVPGLFLLTIWSVGAPAIVAERRGALEAFGRSHELVRGNGWNVFGVIVSVFLILIVATIIVAAIGAAIGGVAGAAIVAIILLVLYMPVQALVQSVLFFDLGGGEAAGTNERAVAGL
jgi:hypothetical protein